MIKMIGMSIINILLQERYGFRYGPNKIPLLTLIKGTHLINRTIWSGINSTNILLNNIIAKI